MLGVVDFREAKLLDRHWWLRLKMLIEEIESQECKNFIEMQNIRHSSALNYLAGKQAFDHHWKQLTELGKQWTALSFPWLNKTDNTSHSELMKRWKRAHKITDLNSPEAQAKINALADDLKQIRGVERTNTQESLSGSWCKT
jgi:hypothetical protein